MKALLDFFHAVRMSKMFKALVIVIAGAFVLSLLVKSCDGCECNACARDPAPISIDASVPLARIERRVDAAVQRAEAQLQQIEHRHQEAIESFNAAEQHEYDVVREQGPKAVEAWINAWYAEQRRERP